MLRKNLEFRLWIQPRKAKAKRNLTVFWEDRKTAKNLKAC